MKWFVYIVQCSNGSYYTGHTHSEAKRLDRHQKGTGAKHTAVFSPQDIVYSEQFETEQAAIRRERQIKRWSKTKKKALIEGDVKTLQELSKSRDHKSQQPPGR